MPIKHAIWTIGEKPAPLARGRLICEQQLEEMIVTDLEAALVQFCEIENDLKE